MKVCAFGEALVSLAFFIPDWRKGMSMLKTIIHQFVHEEDGQGISEYAAVLAFTCFLIILVFSFSQNTLAYALSESVSSIVGQFDRINNATEGMTR